MLDIKLISEQPILVKDNLKKRGFDVSEIDKILALNNLRKELTTKENNLRSELKQLSALIGPLKKKGEDAKELTDKVAIIKDEITKIGEDLGKTELQQLQVLEVMPNLIADDVPVGSSEENNHEIFHWGSATNLSFAPKDHVELGENLGMLDFEAAARVTGSRFVFYKKELARLERACINFMLDQHIQNGYTEMIPPFIVHERSMYGTGQLPKFKEDCFKLENFDWYLVPTAEVPLTNIRREELFDRSELPMLMCAYTPCFRSEAGSYGKDTRGMIRQHQFNKVEMVNIVESDQSVQAHEAMINRARSILELLELPHRGVVLCSGDIGFSAVKTIDLEVWLPSQAKYREISSVSNCGDFQARRASIRYRNKEGKPEFAHTLNGSGLAVGRTVVAIMENYQQEDGSIVIPRVLRPYMGGLEVIKK